MDATSKEMEGSQKKIPIEELSKEDLVKKCKNLLVIAQKAKQAKDDAGEQIKKLTEQLNARQQVNENDKALKLQNEMSAMQEMLATLTQQKLQFAMEMDKLRKKNLETEKELKEATQNAQELRLHVDELETATESYKRQIQRLTEENDAVIKQMDVLDMELTTLKAQKTENETHVEIKEKEAELQTLRDEVERLMEENSRNKDSMKHLYENLHKEKCEAEDESNRLRMEMQTLREELQVSITEKETIINDIKNIRENNLELTRVVKTISDERDKYFDFSEKLSKDILSLQRKLKLEENKKQEMTSENTRLKNELQELFQRFENAQRDISVIKNEMCVLKTENQCLNESLHSLMNVKDELYSECSDTECRLQSMLQQTAAFLYSDISSSKDERIDVKQDKCTVTMINTVSELERNLNTLLSLCTHTAGHKAESEKNNSSNLGFETNTDGVCLESCFSENKLLLKEVVNCEDNLVMKLNNELKLLNEVLLNIEGYAKKLDCENMQLKELISQTKEEAVAQTTKTAMQLQNLEECQQCKELRREMCNLISVRGSEEELRNEVEHCRQSLRQKNLELSLCKEELSAALSTQGFGAPRRAIENVQNCKDHNKLSEEISKLQVDNLNFKREVERLQSLLKQYNEEAKSSNNSTKGFFEQPSRSKGSELAMNNSDFTSTLVNVDENLNHELKTIPVIHDARPVPNADVNENKESNSVLGNFTSSTEQKDRENEVTLSEPISLIGIKQDSKNETYQAKYLQTEDNAILELKTALDETKAMLSNSDKEREEMHCRSKSLEKSLQNVRSELEIAQAKLLQLMEENNGIQQRYVNSEESVKLKSREIGELKSQLQLAEEKLKAALDKTTDIENSKNNLEEVLKMKGEEIKTLTVALQEANMNGNDLRHYKEQIDSTLKEKIELIENLSSELLVCRESVMDGKRRMIIMSDYCSTEEKKYERKIAEVQSLKKELEEARSSGDRTCQELELAKQELVDTQALLANIKEEKNSLMDELKQLENAKSSSVAAEKQLAEIRKELDSLRISSAESSKQFEIAEQQRINTQKLLKEANDSRDKLAKRLHLLTTGLHSASSEISQLASLKNSLKQDVLNLQSEKSWEKIHCALQQAVEKCINNQVEEKTAELLQDMHQMNELLKQRGESLSRLKEINRELEQNLEKEHSKVQSLSKDLSVKTLELEEREQVVQSLECELHKMKSTQEENLHLKEQTIHSLQKEVTKFKECQHELETKTSALEAKEEKIHNLEAELTKHLEKLKELKNKNEVVKAMEEEIQKLRVSDNAKLESDARAKELEDEITSLKFKIQQLERDNENGDAPSEIMSGSTISKAEESSRLRDLEETFEERYTKLRTIAVRLKKKVSELTAQLNQIETEKKRLSAEKAELQTKVTAQAKNLQTMQQEYDSLQDIVETQKSELKSLKKTLEKTVNECESVKVQLQGLEGEREKRIRELEVCMKDKQGLEAATKEMASHIQNLKREKENENLVRREKEKELKRLEEEVKLTERKLAEEIEKHKTTLEQLENMKQECKKRSVLSLEMDDYERSLTDLTQQLAMERNKIKETENHLETQREISRGLQEQITLLEQRLHSEEARSKEVKDQFNTAKAQLIDMQGVVSHQETSISELKAQIELQRDQNESLVLQLSELAGEKQKIMDMGHSQQEALSRQIQVLEDHSLHLKQSLSERERELSDLKAEFENYKVRAQSVLRQKARPEDGSSTFTREDFADELAQLRHKTALLQTRLEDASSKIQTLSVENSALQEDRERMLQRCQELSDTVQDLRMQNSHLQDQTQNIVAEHREALKSQKLQAETLNQCYKKQLEELEERLQKETAALRQQLQLEKEQHALITANNMPSTMPSRPLGFAPITHDIDPKMEITLLEREEGEGSESVDSTSPHLTTSMERGTEPMPLDKLLSMPVESEENVNTGVTDLREQLTLSECRSKHLASLLSEAEQDLAKLTQQNQMLKEEIRRQQRSVEREQHAQNFEYLKNVVLKFITLEGGDERTHLVPVLNTLLKLSPEEVQQLNTVAKGPDLTGVARGWSSYLHRWSGAQ